jgi:hypothetical protein
LVVNPTQALGTPVTAPGITFTDTIAVAAQPIPDVYDITDVPGETLVTRPVPSIVATDVLVLLQVPPGTALLNEVELPLQTDNPPVIAAGSPFTVIPAVAAQPVGGV